MSMATATPARRPPLARHFHPRRELVPDADGDPVPAHLWDALEHAEKGCDGSTSYAYGYLHGGVRLQAMRYRGQVTVCRCVGGQGQCQVPDLVELAPDADLVRRATWLGDGASEGPPPPPPGCMVCGKQDRYRRHGRCGACRNYWERHGRERVTEGDKED
jgi:hypothetical protein